MTDEAEERSLSFGSLLQRHRATVGFTQEQLATRARLSRDAITALERGKRRTPRTATVHLLADALALTGEERAALLAAAQRRVRVEQRESGGGMVASPDLRASAGLPLFATAQPTALIGRVEELEAIRRWLASDEGRLLTLTGPAGVGKTRLALAAALHHADRFPDGVTLIDLTPIRDSLLVVSAVAHGLGLADTGSRPLLERLCAVLRDRSMLLVLDNFEQVLPAASALADLLARCPRLALLVTSRVPLQLRWEWTLRIAPLPVPDLTAPLPALEALGEIPAVTLFVERARARQADFALTATHAPLVARLASELDGLPLALELAAARLDGLALPMIVRRLGERLRLLRWEAPDLPERQRSLEAAIGWSYELLSESDQRLFRRLGVFVGRVALDAIRFVAANGAGAGQAATHDASHDEYVLEGLISLAEKSLVLPAPRQELDVDENSEPAFAMLETVREYAWEQLERLGELEAARRAHAYYFLALAERADTYLRGRDQRTWYAHLEREHNNLRAALRWFLDQDGADAGAEREAGLQLAGALGWFWWTRGYLAEGWRWLDEALSRAPEADPALRARALLAAGAILVYQGEFAHAKTVLDEALMLAQQRHNPTAIAQAFSTLGMRAVYAGELAYSAPLLREASRRWRELDNPHQIGMTLLSLGASAFAQGRDTEAATIYAESLAQFEAAGSKLFASNLHVNLGWFAWRAGDLPTAVRRVRIGLEGSVIFRDRRLLSVSAQTTLVLVSSQRDPANLDRCVQLLGAVDGLMQATGMTLFQTLIQSSMVGLRERLTHDDRFAEAYAVGRSMPFDAIAALALALLEEVA